MQNLSVFIKERTESWKSFASARNLFNLRNNSIKITPVRREKCHELSFSKAFVYSGTYNYGHMPSEILHYIFSFVPSSDLMSVSQTSSRWRIASISDNTLWMSLYYRAAAPSDLQFLKLSSLQTLDYRSQYLQLIRERKMIRTSQKAMYITSSVMKSMYEYPLMYMLVSLVLALLLYSIVPLLMVEKVIPSSARVHALMLIPFVFLVALPIAMVFLSTILAGTIVPRIKKYYVPSDSTSIPYANEVENECWKAEIILIISGIFGAVPVAGISAYVHMLVGSSWRVAFVPVYCYSILYIIAAPIVYFVSGKNRGMLNKLLYVFISIALVYICLQLGLIGSKLDGKGLGSVSWSLVLSPTWALFLILSSIFPIALCMIGGLYGGRGWYKDDYCVSKLGRNYLVHLGQYTSYIAALSCLLFPAVVWLILLCLKVDRNWEVLYVFLWIPLWVLVALLVFGSIVGISLYIGVKTSPLNESS